MPEALLTIAALHPACFEVCLHVPTIEAIDAAITDLLARGYRPARAGDGWQRTPEGHPLCPKHRVPMRLRSKQGDEWWSHQVVDARTGEELYCRGYAGPSSPGWAVPA